MWHWFRDLILLNVLMNWITGPKWFWETEQKEKADDLDAFVSWFWLYLPNLKHGTLITLNSFILPVCFDFCLQIICLFSQFEPGEIMALRPEQLVCNGDKQQLPHVHLCTCSREVLFLVTNRVWNSAPYHVIRQKFPGNKITNILMHMLMVIKAIVIWDHIVLTH